MTRHGTAEADVVITEIGGTVGDIESLPFLEAIRQFRRDVGYKNTMYIHNTLIPYLAASQELKTKPTQHSVKELRSLGIIPDLIILRTEKGFPMPTKIKSPSSATSKKECVIEAFDCDVLYEVPLMLAEQNIDGLICRAFRA